MNGFYGTLFKFSPHHPHALLSPESAAAADIHINFGIVQRLEPVDTHVVPMT